MRGRGKERKKEDYWALGKESGLPGTGEEKHGYRVLGGMNSWVTGYWGEQKKGLLDTGERKRKGYCVLGRGKDKGFWVLG